MKLYRYFTNEYDFDTAMILDQIDEKHAKEMTGGFGACINHTDGQPYEIHAHLNGEWKLLGTGPTLWNAAINAGLERRYKWPF